MREYDRSITCIDDKKTIKQTNRLIEARYKLSLVESKIIYAIGSQLLKSGDNFERVRVSASALIDFCGFSPKHGYSELKKACRTLRQRIIEISYPDGSWYIIGWVNSAFYHNGVIDFQIDERLKNDMLNVNKAYLSASPRILCSFQRVFSPRLYMLLKKAVKIGEIEYDLDFLIDRFVLPKSYRDKFYNFNNKFLMPCVKEINDKTDIAIGYKFIKCGRSYKKIRFTIIAKEDKQQKERTPAIPVVPKWTDEQQKVINRLAHYKIFLSPAPKHLLFIIKIIKDGDLARINRNIDFEIDVDRPAKEELSGAIILAIRDDRAGQYFANIEKKEAENKTLLEEQDEVTREQARETKLTSFEAIAIMRYHRGEKFIEKAYENGMKKVEVLGLSYEKIREIAFQKEDAT